MGATWGSMSVMELEDHMVAKVCVQECFDEVIVVESGNGSTQYANYRINQAGQALINEWVGQTLDTIKERCDGGSSATQSKKMLREIAGRLKLPQLEDLTITDPKELYKRLQDLIDSIQ